MGFNEKKYREKLKRQELTNPGKRNAYEQDFRGRSTVFHSKKEYKRNKNFYYDEEEDMVDIIKIAKDNGFYYDILNYMKDENNNKIENIDGEYRYLRPVSGGRDFFNYVPLDVITDDEREKLEEYYIEDFYIEDYDWNGIDIDEVKEYLYDDLLDSLFDELQK